MATRVTQRAPRTCTECARKKRKCSKTVPCDACVREGASDRCQREQVFVSKELRLGAGRVRKNIGTRRHEVVEPRDPSHEQMLISSIEQNSNAESQSNPSSTITSIGGAKSSVNHRCSHQHDTLQAPGIWVVEQSHSDSQETSVTEHTTAPYDSTATTLEHLVWGKDINYQSPTVPCWEMTGEDILTSHQATVLIDHHQRWLAWTHNFINWPQFRDECFTYWNTGFIPEKAWLSLYSAVLCVSVHYMSADQRSRTVAPNIGPDLPKRLYLRCMSHLHEAEYLSVHSVRSLQTICLIILCAHEFGGSSLVSVLLSCATRIAQCMGIHRLGPDPPTGNVSLEQLVDREVRKALWLFLKTQDWFLIPFNNAYSINPLHSTTPPPINCNGIGDVCAERGSFDPVPISQPTLMTFTLCMNKVAEISRSFFDETATLSVSADENDVASHQAFYNAILKADSKMKAVMRSLPEMLKTPGSSGDNAPLWLEHLRRHFTISAAHKTLMIHRHFFLKSLTNPWYNFTRMTCMTSARTILTQFSSWPSDKPGSRMWAAIAHAVSAAVILLLDMTVLKDEDREEFTVNRELVLQCKNNLEKLTRSSSLAIRGNQLITILLANFDHDRDLTLTQINVSQIATSLQAELSGSMVEVLCDGLLNIEPGELDQWLQSLGENPRT